MLRPTLYVCAACGVAIISHVAHAQPARFIPLGHVTGGPEYSIGFRASHDGQAVVGISQDASDFVAFRWTSMDTMVSLGRLAPGPSQAFALSAEGRTVVGSSAVAGGGMNAFRWTAVEGLVSLGDLPGATDYSAAYACSADASVIVGIANYDALPAEEIGRGQAFRWTNAGGMQGLAYLRVGDTFGDAEHVTPNGAFIVGASGLEGTRCEAVRWSAGVPTGLGDLPGGRLFSFAYGCSPDGAVVVGQGESSSGTEAFRWSAGVMAPLGDLPGGAFESVAVATTSNGSTIVGFSATADQPREVFIWTKTAGMRRLIDVLQSDYNLDLTGWVLRHASSISPDGRFIAGDGINPSGQREAWLVDLGAGSGCTADFNHDGTVNSQDFFDFLNAFFSCM